MASTYSTNFLLLLWTQNFWRSTLARHMQSIAPFSQSGVRWSKILWCFPHATSALHFSYSRLQLVINPCPGFLPQALVFAVAVGFIHWGSAVGDVFRRCWSSTMTPSALLASLDNEATHARQIREGVWATAGASPTGLLSAQQTLHHLFRSVKAFYNFVILY